MIDTPGEATCSADIQSYYTPEPGHDEQPATVFAANSLFVL